MEWLDLRLDDPTRWDAWTDTPDGVPRPVGPRWRRSLEAGADPEGPHEEPVVGAIEVREHRDRMGVVLPLLDDVVAPSADLFDARDFILLFADRDGVIVDARAGGGFRDAAATARLQPGAVWNEATRGTNAIGTALAEQRPVAVHGGAHFARPNHGLVCYAAPVRDPWGELIGVLDATSFAERADPLAAVAVLHAARTLEEALRVRTLERIQPSLVERLLGRLRDPALLVGPDGRVTFANRPALEQGLPLGPRFPAGPDVARVRARIDEVLPVGVAQIDASARGQIRLPGLEVEAVHTPEGRVAAWLVVLVPSRPAEAPPLRPAPTTASPLDAVVGTDPAVHALRAHAEAVAASTLPILVLGETGSGKEVLARAVHAASHRATQPFVAVNCGALTPALLHSELFGYAPGAFTGADPRGREGRLAMAHGGTLFLDELAEMPAEVQALLLRFLEDGSYHRVGESVARHADVRLLAATCRDLPGRVDDGRFRADLFYRLRGVTLTLPPVRERRDRGLLARVLLERLAQELGLSRVPDLTPEARQRIDAHPWPGNVRELKMALHHAVVLARGSERIEAWHLPDAPTQAEPPAVPDRASPSLAELEIDALRRALAEADGNVSAAARQLGIARSTVYRMLKRHGLA